MDVDDYAGRDGMLAFYRDCRGLAAAGEVGQLIHALSTKASRTYEKHEVARIAAGVLASMDSTGIAALGRFLESADVGGLRASAALRALWLASQGQSPVETVLGISYPVEPVALDLQAQARVVVDDFIAAASTSAEHSRVLVALQQQEFDLSRDDALPPLTAHILKVTRESSIVLTLGVIEEWEALVAQDLPEKDYQNFLEKHPVLVDPLAAEVLNRKRLGLELVTDFVVRRHDYRYVVVEIEKPQDRIFTQADDFAAPFTHAMGQILDFQGWVAENVAYAQKHLPGIENPHGVLIMGRRSEVTHDQEAKLRRWLHNSKNIEVLTFDDLSVRARALHTSLRGAVTPPAT
ncbi:Shedu immune nuclease family protein [Nocardioides sp. BYT-33-1]|uniref:Shedu immune nuclease family protein n=1 Tax=Nocardioides sp. BYT-33-1 TaxID=3416952 RepID=UPI003F52F4A9